MALDLLTVFGSAGASSNAIDVAALCRARLLPLGLAESSGGVKVRCWGFTGGGFRASNLQSLDWFKGKSTGNHGFYHQI